MRRLLPLGAAVLLGLLAAPALGAVYDVDVTTDANSTCTAGSCSLREAVKAANASEDVPDSINLHGLTVQLTIGGTDDSNAVGDLDVGAPGLATAGELTISNGTIVGSVNDRAIQVLAGEALRLHGVTIEGNPAPHSTSVGGGVYVESGGTVSSTSSLETFSSTFTGNTADTGGAIDAGSDSTVTVTQTTFDHNTAGIGGGGAVSSYGDLTVTSSTFTANGTNGGRGGAIDAVNGTLVLTGSYFERNQAGDGGGLAIELTTANTVSTTTFVGNTATEVGGGIFIQHPTTATNITVTGNTAQDATAFGGGGMFVQGNLDLEHATVTGNSGPNAPDIGLVSGTLTAANTLVAGTCRLADAATLTSLGGNVDSGVSCGFLDAADRRSQTVRLGPLQSDNGQFVLPLLGGSGAIDAGVAAHCAATDQRSAPRVPTECDSGAYEAAKTDLRAALAATPSPLALGGDLTLALTAFNDGPRATSGVIGTLALPAGVSFVSGTGDGGAPCSAGPPVTCPLGALDPGVSRAASVVVHPSAAGALTFSGSIVADLAEALPGNETASTQALVNAAVPDTTKPKVSLALKKGTTRRSIRRSRRIRVKVTVDEAAKLTLRATTKRRGRTRSLGRAQRTFAAPGTVTLTIKLSRKARALLGTGRLTLSASATDGAGNVGTVKRSPKLRRR